MKILVFMSDNRLLEPTQTKAEYNSLCAAINYEYCTKYGYDFIYYRPYLFNKDIISLYNCKDPASNDLRHASRSKLLSTKLALQTSYDYVVYIDSDCIFKDFNQNLIDFIQPYSDKDIIFLNNKPWGDTLPCAGFYICKVNNYTKQFIDNWYNMKRLDKNKIHAWEQDALWNIYRCYNIGIIDSWMFQESPLQFLRHIGGNDGANRVPYFNTFIESMKIPYEQHIRAISVIDFDTDSIVIGGRPNK